MARLLNRRFVPFYFDMFGGHAADGEARAVVARQRPALAGGSIGDNPLLFLTPDGEIVGEIAATAATTPALLAKLEQVLRQHPELARPTPAEAAIADPIERAELLIDLRRDAEADAVLARVDAPRAHYLRGRLARMAGDFAAMRAHFAKVEPAGDLAADVRMETAYEAWHARDHERLAAALADFPAQSARTSEARYHEGLALFHCGRVKEARALWRAAITSLPQDRWVYRMDWAWADSAKQQGGRSPLGRIGYLGAYRNPDLKPAR